MSQSISTQQIRQNQLNPLSFPDARLEPQLAAPVASSKMETTQLENLTRQLENTKRIAENLAQENADVKSGFQREREQLLRENEKLRGSLIEAQTEREQGVDALDKMLIELLEAQQELEEKNEILERKSADSSSGAMVMENGHEWRKRENELLEQMNELKTAIQHINEQREKDTHVAKENITLAEDRIRELEEEQVQELNRKETASDNEVKRLQAMLQSKEVTISELKIQQLESKQVMTQETASAQEIQELRAFLAAKEETISKMETKEQRSRELESKYNSLEQKTQMLDTLLAAKDTRITQLDSEIAANKSSTKELCDRLAATTLQSPDNNMKQLVESQAAELEQLQPMLNFFKRSSERLTREAKDMESRFRVLEDEMASKDREIEEYKARAPRRDFGDWEDPWRERVERSSRPY